MTKDPKYKIFGNGALNKSTSERTSDKSPDFYGRLKLDEPLPAGTYKLSGWTKIKKDDGTSFISISITPNTTFEKKDKEEKKSYSAPKKKVQHDDDSF